MLNFLLYLTKKYYILILFGLSFLLIIFLTFFVFNVHGLDNGINKETRKESHHYLAENNKLFILEKSNVLLNYWIEDNKLYYFDKNNNFYIFNFLDKKKKEENLSFSGIKRIKILKNHNKAIVFWEKNRKKGASIFNPKIRGLEEIPEENIIDASFSPDGNRVIFYAEDNKLPYLAIYDIKLKKIKKILDIPIYDLRLEWVSNKKIFIAERPICQNKQNIYIFDLNSKSFSKIASGYGLEYLISPSRDKIIISFEKKMISKVVNLDNKILANLRDFIIPAKCQFDEGEKNLYCAIPKNIPKNICLPDDYWLGKLNSGEKIIKINLESLAQNNIFDSDFSDIINILPIGDSLVFFDRISGHLYFLKK